jgi:hypothetical protein
MVAEEAFIERSAMAFFFFFQGPSAALEPWRSPLPIPASQPPPPYPAGPVAWLTADTAAVSGKGEKRGMGEEGVWEEERVKGGWWREEEVRVCMFAYA